MGKHPAEGSASPDAFAAELPPESPFPAAAAEEPAVALSDRREENRSQHNNTVQHTKSQSPPQVPSPPYVPKAPLTKAERKRLEWQKDREELEILKQQSSKTLQNQQAQQQSQQPALKQPPPQQQQQASSSSAATVEQQILEAQLQELQRQIEAQKKQIDTLSPRLTQPQQQQQQQPQQQQPQQQPQQQHHTPQPPQQPTPAPMTKAQRKKLQWDQEKTEQQSEWNPWGKPGAGAPMSPPVAGLSAPPLMTQQPQQPQQHPPAPYEPISRPVAGQHSEPSYIPGLTTASPRVDPPAAIRSSFVIGTATPDGDRYASAKDRQKKQWLQELEQQREEQRLRKLKEKQMKNDGQDTWADRMTGPANKQPPQYQQPPQQQQMLQQPQQQQYGAPTPAPMTTTQQQPLDASMSGRASSAPGDASTFLRGQNMFVDSQTLKEMDEKRLKQMAHQAYIRDQMAEKERLRQEEKDKKRAEEQQEEARLQKDRDELQKQFDHEQQKARNREDAQRRQVEQLKAAMDEAKEQADREKHAVRLHKLQQGGHDVSHLHASFTAKSTPRDVGVASSLSRHNVPSSLATHNEPIFTEPAYIPGLSEPPPQMVTQTIVTQQQQYNAQREFGVQTEVNTPEIEYSGPLHEPTRQKSKVQKKVRVQSAAEEDKQSMVKKRRKPVPIQERPKWGSKVPPKKMVKQSERDPFYEQKKQRLENTKAIRAAELRKLTNANSPRIPEDATIASRNRSRSRDRSPAMEEKRRSQSKSPIVVTRLRYDTPDGGSVSAGFGKPGQSKHIGSVNTSGRLSPPVPAIKYHSRAEEYNYDNHAHSRLSSRAVAADPGAGEGGRHSRYTDVEQPLDEFVPFIRSNAAVLDPARAEEPLPMSREATVVQRGRMAYRSERDPARYGNSMINIDERTRDPLMNPEVLMEHPSQRQNKILQQLSELRRGLVQKRREMEMGLAPPQALDEDQLT